MSFTFVDLFAGIGGFHAAMSAMGGTCVYAVEIDEAAASVYQRNWGHSAIGDITLDANESRVVVPAHDVLLAGFPCQPFSKSGAQLGMDETRGTLFWNILKVIDTHHPALVVLENVRNISGPRHAHEWDIIIKSLRQAGYRVDARPLVVSPHRIPPDRGGRPQVRERVFIVAIRDDSSNAQERAEFSLDLEFAEFATWNIQDWNLARDLPLSGPPHPKSTELTESEILWIDAWNEFVEQMWELRNGVRLPGFPLWGDEWRDPKDLDIPTGTPKWKSDYLKKNADFYADYREFIDGWKQRWNFESFPPSRRKFEWQAQDCPRLWDTVMHLRPSGIRAKKPNYLPALVAITQTSIIGPERRRLSPREAARLQGLPDWFDFGNQPDSASYKQLGNGVNVGAVWNVVRESVLRYQEIILKTSPRLVNAVQNSPESPDGILARHQMTAA